MDKTVIALVPVFLAIVALANTALIGWLALHQAKMAKTVDAVKTQTDGISERLVESTGEAKHAQGVLEEKARAKAETESNQAAVAVAENKPKS